MNMDSAVALDAWAPNSGGGQIGTTIKHIFCLNLSEPFLMAKFSAPGLGLPGLAFDLPNVR